jgi:hypothetical protein
LLHENPPFSRSPWHKEWHKELLENVEKQAKMAGSMEKVENHKHLIKHELCQWSGSE